MIMDMEYEKTGTDASLIMIVDDVETNRVILNAIVSDMGYRTVEAENGLEALEMLPECNPHLILLDISMPEMDGYELCRVLKERPETRDIPIIFISAYDEPEDIVKGFSLGGGDYITKPFIPELVQARVGVHLKLYKASLDLVETNRRLQASVSEQLYQMEQEKRSVLYALANAAAENSNFQKEYMERVQYNCRILTQAMQLSSKFEHIISDAYVDTIEMAVPLCDVGNISISRDLLHKAEELSADELEVVKEHTIIGAQLLSDLNPAKDYNDFMQMSIDIAYSHHENWDGSGYPQGLKGNEIPLCAQIVAIVSAYCSLTEKRPRQESYDNEDALKAMEKDVNVKFNPDIFYIFQKIFRHLK